MMMDFVIVEEYRGLELMRKIKVQIVLGWNLDLMVFNQGSFVVDVCRIIGFVKIFFDMVIDIYISNLMRIIWGLLYQFVIQDMMMVIELMMKLQFDLFEKVGFWDKIWLNFYFRVWVVWREGGDVYLVLKGSRDFYQVIGNGVGFIMCWRKDVRWNIYVDDDLKWFMMVDSGEYVFVVFDYSYYVCEMRRQYGEDESFISDSSYKFGVVFKKVVMKLFGKV